MCKNIQASEPVMVIGENESVMCRELPVGTKLYTTPQPAAECPRCAELDKLQWPKLTEKWIATCAENADLQAKLTAAESLLDECERVCELYGDKNPDFGNHERGPALKMLAKLTERKKSTREAVENAISASKQDGTWTELASRKEGAL